MVNDYGNFFFYSQHQVQVLGEIFGYYPNSVQAFVNGDVVTCIVRYDNYDITLEFVENNYSYYACISCEKKSIFSEYSLDGCFKLEFDAFYRLLKGEEQLESYGDFIAPVFIINAIDRSVKSGKEEKVNRA